MVGNQRVFPGPTPASSTVGFLKRVKGCWDVGSLATKVDGLNRIIHMRRQPCLAKASEHLSQKVKLDESILYDRIFIKICLPLQKCGQRHDFNDASYPSAEIAATGREEMDDWLGKQGPRKRQAAKIHPAPRDWSRALAQGCMPAP